MPRSSDYLPMPAFVGADAAELAGGLEVRQMPLNGRTIDTKLLNQVFLR